MDHDLISAVSHGRETYPRWTIVLHPCYQIQFQIDFLLLFRFAIGPFEILQRCQCHEFDLLHSSVGVRRRRWPCAQILFVRIHTGLIDSSLRERNREKKSRSPFCSSAIFIDETHNMLIRQPVHNHCVLLFLHILRYNANRIAVIDIEWPIQKQMQID